MRFAAPSIGIWIEDDLYFDVVFNSWGQASGGGFSYTRTQQFVSSPEWAVFSNTSGIIPPGESQTITVIFNPNGTEDGDFIVDLEIRSNAEWEIEIG